MSVALALLPLLPLPASHFSFPHLDLDPSILVRHRDVARVQPAPGESGFSGRLILEISAHDCVATHEDLRGGG